MRTLSWIPCAALVAALASACASVPALADAPGRPTVLSAVQIVAGADSTRLVLQLAHPSTPTVEADSAAGGFHVTLKSAVLAPGVAITRDFPTDPAIRSYRIAEVPEGLRLTVRMAAFGKASATSRPASGSTPAAVVVDVPRPGHELAAVARARAEAAAKRAPASPVIEAKRVDRSHAERIVVIDPGHGGDATGAVGPKRTLEKDVCLEIAKRLAEKLQSQAGVRVVLTRSGDYNLGLRERYQIAERARADAFVSIHANSGRTRTGRGTEVYFLSLESASDEAAKHLADAENAADMVGGVPAQEEEIVSILFDLQQQAAIRQSQGLAETVLQHIVAARRLTSRGVKQAPFAVLKSPVVPSILVETAFINHPEEAKLLRDPQFQDEIAGQIASGLIRYLETAPVIDRASGTSGAINESGTGRSRS